MSKKRILIIGAGSGFGEGASIGLAQNGHEVIAGVQISPTINPGAFLTGFNETMAESVFRWQDDTRNFIKRVDIQKFFNFLGDEGFQRDPKEIIDAMVSIVPADAGLFRNVLPKADQEFVKTNQNEAWERRM